MRLALLAVLGGCHLVFLLNEPEGDEPVPIVDRWQHAVAGYGHTCGIDDQQQLFCWGRNINGELGRPGELVIEEKGRVPGLWSSASAYGHFFKTHMCGIQMDNTASCWGANNFGQLGIGVASGDQDPVTVQLPTEVAAIAAGALHSCAIDVDGALYCWGSNLGGQVGDGSKTDRPLPTQIGTDKAWRAVAAGFDTSCAIANDETLWCWGKIVASAAPIQVETDVWLKVSVGQEHVCGVTRAGQMKCFGRNFEGQLGDGTTTVRTTLDDVIVDGDRRSDWTDVAINGEHSCGLTRGEWWCWGSSSTGQLGLDGTGVNSVPVQLGTEHGLAWQQLAAGFGHNCAVATDQTMWCVGRRGFGELGDGAASPKVPTQLPGQWRAVDLGWSHVCAIALDGHVECAGINGFGTLGNGTRDGKRVFAPINDEEAYNTIRAGTFHTCGLRSNNTATCWGANYAGQSFPDAPGGNRLSPAELGSAIHVTAFGDHTCKLSGAGDATCWGTNNFGETGNGQISALAVPTLVTGGPWLTIEAGEVHTCAIRNDGVTFCWGSGRDGRVGNTTAKSSPGDEANPVPIQVVMPNAVNNRLVVGDGTSCASTAPGATQCWGSNYGGEIGNGVASSQPTPISIGSWSALSIGATHGCGIQNGTLECWGSNLRGELGIDSLTDSSTPVQVGTDTTWRSVACGEQFTCAIDATNTMYCWGDNQFGQVGDDTAWKLEAVQIR